MLNIKDLLVSIDEQSILKNLNLSADAGSLHAIMGPNGSGKSTLAHAIAGNPQFKLRSGSIIFNGQDITHLSPHERARLGIFLLFQQPPAIPGLSVFDLLKEAYQAVSGNQIEMDLFHLELLSYCQLLKMDQSFLERSCNDGFSGGEKKRFELLQLLVLKPKLVILDEIDSGLDVDALKLIGRVLKEVKRAEPDAIFLIITHYQRILEYIDPHQVHVLIDGAIKESGTMHLADTIAKQGYDGYRSNI